MRLFGLSVLAGTAWLSRDERWQLLMSLLLHLMLVKELLVFVLFYFVLVEDQIDNLDLG